MRNILFSLLTASSTFFASAQITFDFESLTLPKADTFYVNYSDPGNDVGFGAFPIHFQCYYDTLFGGLWTKGFAYSNMTDSVTSGYLNQYSAKTAKGFNNSNNYAVYWDGYGTKAKIKSTITSQIFFLGFYITNSTYSYNSMRDGDFVSRKFGDTTGTNSGLAQGAYPDWFKVTVKGYSNGAIQSDTVDFYLADFRFNDSDSDYIVKDWRWVDISPLNLGVQLDSLEFHLSSSDSGQFGMNTPAYFCIDDFKYTIESSVTNLPSFAAKIYPNPAINELNVEVNENEVKNIFVKDMTGKTLSSYKVKNKLTTIPTSQLSSGMYLLQITNGKQSATQRFIKQ